MIHLTLTPWAIVRVRIEPHPRSDSVALETMAIIDTGAEVTHISPEVFHELDVLRFSRFIYEGQLRTATLEFPGY